MKIKRFVCLPIFQTNMILRLVPCFVFLSFIVCSPHNHKSKEEVPDDFFTSRDSKHYKDGKHDYNFDHEAVLGSHDAAAEFDHLPPDEAKNKLLHLAIKMDTNKDEYVDRKELTNWVLRSFKMLTEEEALDEFEDEDINDDGQVRWEEHASEIFGLSNDEQLSYKDSPEESEMYENDLELFKGADLNGDGSLDKLEYPSFSHPEEFEHMHDIVYNQAMQKRDKNNDGFLSFEEFLGGTYDERPVQTTEHYLTEKDRFENDYDIDGDKKLNKEEVMIWLIPNNQESAENEADHLIESSDTNKDGKLTFDEIVQHYNVFVGSEATDYGEHLNNFHKYSDEL